MTSGYTTLDRRINLPKMVTTRTRSYDNEPLSRPRSGKKKIAPTFIRPLRIRVPPPHRTWSSCFRLQCPTGEVPCCWAPSCMCLDTELHLQEMASWVEDTERNGSIARFQILRLLEGPTPFDFESFSALSYDEQHAHVVRKQVMADRSQSSNN